MSFGLVKMTGMEACSMRGKANEPPFPRPQKPPAEELVNYSCHSLDLSSAGCNHPATHTQENGGGWKGDQGIVAMLCSSAMSSHQVGV